MRRRRGRRRDARRNVTRLERQGVWYGTRRKARYAHVAIPTGERPWAGGGERRRGKGETPSHVRVSLVGDELFSDLTSAKNRAVSCLWPAHPPPSPPRRHRPKAFCARPSQALLAHVAPPIRPPHRPRFPTSSTQYPHSPDNRFMTC